MLIQPSAFAQQVCSPYVFALKALASQLGYKQPGLARTTAAVLGAVLPKPKSVSMSNWQAPQLTARQIQYAALDALLAGHAFRGLRSGSAEHHICAILDSVDAMCEAI
jgi:hypothetical protein